MAFLNDRFLKSVKSALAQIKKTHANKPKLVAALDELEKDLISFGKENPISMTFRYVGDKIAEGLHVTSTRFTIQKELAPLVVCLYEAALEMRGVQSSATKPELNKLALQILLRAPKLKASFDAYDKTTSSDLVGTPKPRKTIRLARFLNTKKSALNTSNDPLVLQIVALLKKDGLLPKQDNPHMFDDLKNTLLELLLKLEDTLKISDLLKSLIVENTDLGSFTPLLLKMKDSWPGVLQYARDSIESAKNNVSNEDQNPNVVTLMPDFKEKKRLNPRYTNFSSSEPNHNVQPFSPDNHSKSPKN